jgi:uncharacterized phage protein (TIGR01671 family)
MRDIKFRGLKTNGKGWAYGDLHKGENIRGEIYYEVGYGHNYYKVLPETVGQFTGLKDKNGVEIYEGNIVSDGKTLFEIQMNVQQGKWWTNPIKQIQEHQEDWFILALDNQQLGNGYYSRKDLEVIGNIHENQELLKS